MNGIKVFYLALVLIVSSFFLLHFAGIYKSSLKLINIKRPSSSVFLRATSSSTRTGYVLATHYSDQLTGSMWNTLSLQCWASTLPGDVRVVEPFLHYGSLLGFNLNPYPDNGTVKPDGKAGPRYTEGQKFENTVKLSDIIDINEWSEYVSANNLAPLINWSSFIEHMPKQMIIVAKMCGSGQCMECEEDFFESKLFAKFATKFAKFHHVDLVRTVCFKPSFSYTQESFLETVYGDYSPNNTFVVFNHFGGISGGIGDKFRVSIAGTDCSRSKFVRPIHSSPHLLDLTSRYVKEYMPQASRKGYISVMVRSEYILLSNKFQRMSMTEKNKTLNRCLDDIVKAVNQLKLKQGISDVFVATDVGPYGSAYTRGDSNLISYKILVGAVQRFYRQLLKHPQAMDRNLKRYKDLIPVLSPGYVAQFEKTIASNGTCLVQAGGGAFHGAVKHLYSSKGKTCTVELGNCMG